MVTKILLIGGSGRVGKILERLISADHSLKLMLSANSKTTESELLAAAKESNVIIDFSNRESFKHWLGAFLKHKIYRPFISGTTALTSDEFKLLDEYGKSAPVLQENNMATSVNLFFMVSELLGKHLTEEKGFKRKIEEIHHTKKLDAPSGTAISIAKHLHGNCPIESKRIGDVVGDHTLFLDSPEEEMIIIHRAKSRDLFAKGALNAALWLKDQSPKRYSMRDYLEHA